MYLIFYDIFVDVEVVFYNVDIIYVFKSVFMLINE